MMVNKVQVLRPICLKRCELWNQHGPSVTSETLTHTHNRTYTQNTSTHTHTHTTMRFRHTYEPSHAQNYVT